MSIRFRRKQQSGQWTLIGIIVAISIIVVLSAWMLPKYLMPGGAGGPSQSPEEDAQDVACVEYYNQIGTAITEYKDEHGHPPRSLRRLQSEGVTQDMAGDPYCNFTYDPQSGMLGDRDVPLPTSATPTPLPANTTAGTPGYNGIATTTAPPPSTPGTVPPQIGNGSGDVQNGWNGGAGGSDQGDGDFGGGRHHRQDNSSSSDQDPISALTN